MAIKRGSKVDKAFSAASMTDLMFLLLLFLLISTTLINPNAVKVLLPQSNNKIKEKPYTTLTITPDLKYYVEKELVPFDKLEDVLRAKLSEKEKPMVSLHCDESVPVGEMVKVSNILIRNKWQMILATRPL